MLKRGVCKVDRKSSGTGDFGGLLLRSLGPRIDVRINADGGLFSATHWRRDAGDAMGCLRYGAMRFRDWRMSRRAKGIGGSANGRV